jgi:hypothetical protein
MRHKEEGLTSQLKHWQAAREDILIGETELIEDGMTDITLSEMLQLLG